jgi:hypothetical protein
MTVVHHRPQWCFSFSILKGVIKSSTMSSSPARITENDTPATAHQLPQRSRLWLSVSKGDRKSAHSNSGSIGNDDTCSLSAAGMLFDVWDDVVRGTDDALNSSQSNDFIVTTSLSEGIAASGTPGIVLGSPNVKSIDAAPSVADESEARLEKQGMSLLGSLLRSAWELQGTSTDAGTLSAGGQALKRLFGGLRVRCGVHSGLASDADITYVHTMLFHYAQTVHVTQSVPLNCCFILASCADHGHCLGTAQIQLRSAQVSLCYWPNISAWLQVQQALGAHTIHGRLSCSSQVD